MGDSQSPSHHRRRVAKYGVMDSTRPRRRGDIRHAHDTCGHGKPSSHAQTMGVPGSVQDDMANFMDLGHGRMANCVHGQLWVPSVQEGDYPSRHHPHPPALCSPIAYATSSRVASGAGTRYERFGAGLLHTSGVRVRGDRGPTGKRSTPPTPHGTTELTAPSHLALGLPRLLAYSPSSLESSLSHRRSNHRAERPKRVGTCSFQCSVNKPCSAT